MCQETICQEFLKLFATNGQPVKLLEKPKTEQGIDLGKGIRGVRFDVIAEDTDYHIYCIDSQRVFMQDSYTDRTLYYGCSAMAAKSLKKNEDFKQLRPVTVIFIYIDNTASTESIDVMNVYKNKDVQSRAKDINPYNSKLTFIDINLNNKANCKTDDQFESDMRAFMDLMSNGDDEHLVELILADPKLSDSMRNVIEIFRGLMTDVIRKAPIDEKEYTPYLDEILRKDEVFTMTTGQLLLQEGEKKGEQRGILKGKVELYYTKLNLKPHEIADEMKITEDEVYRILIELKLVS
jgi:predicted transposase/invertase (TIGR01784 family)